MIATQKPSCKISCAFYKDDAWHEHESILFQSCYKTSICTERLGYFGGYEKFYMRDCFQGELMIPNQWRVFQGGGWTPSAYYDMDGVVNEQFGWGIWMGVANMDRRWGIWHIFLKYWEVVYPLPTMELHNFLSHENESMNCFFNLDYFTGDWITATRHGITRKQRQKRNEHKVPE